MEQKTYTIRDINTYIDVRIHHDPGKYSILYEIQHYDNFLPEEEEIIGFNVSLLSNTWFPEHLFSVQEGQVRFFEYTFEILYFDRDVFICKKLEDNKESE